MSLTSYRAAPPRDNCCAPLLKKPKRIWPTPEAPILSGGFLRRQPGPKPLGASGMYQRRCALERAASDVFGVLSWSKRALFRAKSPREKRSCRKFREGPALRPNEQGRMRVADTFDFVVVGGGSGGCA